MSDVPVKPLAPPPADDRLPLWDIARRWAGGDEVRAKQLYARLWVGYWRGEFLAEAFQFWVRAAPDKGTFVAMPPTGPGGLFGLADGEESLGRFVSGVAEPGSAGIVALVHWKKDDYDRIRSRLLRVYIDGAHITRAGFRAWCERTGTTPPDFWPDGSVLRDLLQACRVWLATRKSLRGDESRKILQEAAQKELPGLSDMDFRQAFRDVYGRKPPETDRNATPAID
ncbi:MAG: hypothetical protein HY058_12905 [Proteobacteria bacterium]|nr:hypothetical protein [Pseudomonadota bacterium]